MDINKLESFLFSARSATGAKAGGEVAPVLAGTTQAEYTEGEWLYRDVYYDGEPTFSGVEAVIYQGNPVWAGSYFGKKENSTWQEIDPILQKVANQFSEAMGYKRVELDYDGYKYVCEPDLQDGISEIGGSEVIYRGEEQIYTFYYAGGLLSDTGN